MQSYDGDTHPVPPSASVLSAPNSTVIQRVLEAHRARSHQSLEQTYPGFPFDVFELGTLDLPLLPSRGQYVWTLKMRYKKSPAEHYWTLKFDGNRIAAFSVPRKTMSKLKDFAIDGPLVIHALQRSFESNGERVELEVGTTVETPYIEPTTRIRASFPASPLVIRVQYDSPDGKTTSPSTTRYWPIGFHRCGASRCKRVFATGAYCEKHHPFQRRV
ncbi:hypothetical protein C8F01DRAFT_1261916 [Mycena amicta]|nr:hypothetical protein C8F01DRAFT_1261916 [Mycena amicta]